MRKTDPKLTEIPRGFRRIWRLWHKTGLLSHKEWRDDFIRKSIKYGFPYHRVIEWMKLLEEVQR